MNRRAAFFSALCALALTGCANVQLGGQKKKVVLKDFAEGRVVQTAITDRLTGAKEMLFVSMPKKSLFLEGYIQGLVVDYDDNPIQGVVVRAVARASSSSSTRARRPSRPPPSTPASATPTASTASASACPCSRTWSTSRAN